MSLFLEINFLFQCLKKSLDNRLTSLIPSELNFWLLLLGILEFSTFSEQILLGACFLSLLLVFLNLSWNLFKRFSADIQEILLFLLLIFLMISIPWALVLLLPLIFFRAEIAAFLASFYMILIALIWISPWNLGTRRYSAIFQEVLPFFAFFLFLSSIGYWFYLSNLLAFYFILLFYNSSFLSEFFEEEWTPMILRSSLLFNFFRFFLPFPLISEVFLFSELLIFGPSLLGLIKVAALAPKLTSYEKFLTMYPRPRSLSTLTGASMPYLVQFQHFKQVLGTDWELLIDELTKPDNKASREIVSDSVNTLPVTKFQPFFEGHNFYKSRELVHWLFFKERLPDYQVLHSSPLFPGEAIPALHPRTSVKFASENALLKHYSVIEGVKSPFIFYWEELWYLALPPASSEEAFSAQAFRKGLVLSTLNDTSRNPLAYKHSFKGFKSFKSEDAGVALFPAQDLTILQRYKFEWSIQCKSSSPEEDLLKTATADFFCVIRVSGDLIQVLEVPSNKVIFSESLAVFKKRLLLPDVKHKVIESFLQDIKLLEDPQALNKVRFDAAQKIIPLGPKLVLPKADL